MLDWRGILKYDGVGGVRELETGILDNFTLFSGDELKLFYETLMGLGPRLSDLRGAWPPAKFGS